MDGRGSTPTTRVMASRITPLGIIAGFVALSETAGAVAATVTQGPIQVAFTCFAIGFPLLAGTAFFVTLWSRNYVLYPPNDFGSSVDVQRYVEAMRHQTLGNQEVLSLVLDSIDAAMSAPQTQETLSRLASTKMSLDSSSALREASLEIAKQATDRIRSSMVTVEIGDLLADEVPVQVLLPFDADDGAFDFLTAVYSHFMDEIPPFTYGQLCALEDTQTGELLLPESADWRDNYRLAEEGAKVSDLGLEAGMNVRAVRLGKEASRRNSP